MRLHIIVVAFLALWSLPSGADSPPPEKIVERLLYANHGFGELAGKDLQDTWAEVRRDPKPYLPALLTWVTWERIEAATDEQQLRGTLGAISLLLLIGGEEERTLVVSRLKQLHLKRDELSARVKRQSREFTSLSDSEKKDFRAEVQHTNRLIRVEGAILKGFGEMRDPRLRDMLLLRLDHDSDMLDRYLSYFEATGLKDPVVRTRVKKMLDAPPSEDPLLEQRLRHFLSAQ